MNDSLFVVSTKSDLIMNTSTAATRGVQRFGGGGWRVVLFSFLGR